MTPSGVGADDVVSGTEKEGERLLSGAVGEMGDEGRMEASARVEGTESSRLRCENLLGLNSG